MRIRQAQPKRAHFIGIGGIGVSALARYFLSQNWELSGSDKTSTPLLQELRAEGVKIKIGHQKKNLAPKPDLVVYTQAIPLNNPELREAKKLKIRAISYPKALGELTKEFTTIALAGTHGKSTATALTALALMEAKMDPTVIVGTKVPQLRNRNFRAGKSKYLIIEADEYKDAFLNYSPSAALITNIDREHLDYFKDLNHIKRSFLKFISNLWLSDSHRLRRDEVLVLNKDNAPLLSLRNEPHFAQATRGKEVIWYSLKEKKLALKIKKHLEIPGEHNLSNALGVYKLARALGVKEKDILKTFSQYHGAWRRMEYRGKLQIANRKSQISVYDDYAHHPTEVKATLSAFREKFPRSKIICVFQPHQAERLNKLFKEFTDAFDEADHLILLDIFKVRGREKTRSKKQEAGSKKLAQAIQGRRGSPKTTYLRRPGSLKNLIIRNLFKIQNSKFKINRPRAVVVMMGAGNIVDLTPKLLESRS